MTNKTFRSTHPRRAHVYRTITDALRRNNVEFTRYYADERTSTDSSNICGRSMRFWGVRNMNDDTAARVTRTINRAITKSGYTVDLFETKAADGSRHGKRVIQVFKA